MLSDFDMAYIVEGFALYARFLVNFVFSSHGVYYEPNCSNTTLDHAMLIVGYGTLNGKQYWTVKNKYDY